LKTLFDDHNAFERVKVNPKNILGIKDGKLVKSDVKYYNFKATEELE